MPLSQVLQKRLIECYVDHTATPKAVPFTYNSKPHPVGGDWFCPECGVKIEETSPGEVKCTICGHYITEFIYQLIERHPHKTPQGTWN
jgi:rubrerythrin